MQDYQPRMLSTYALTLFRHNAEIDGEPVKVDFWDTAGQEIFRAMNRQYFRDVSGCILVYDVTKEKSFSDMEGWLKEFIENCSC